MLLRRAGRLQPTGPRPGLVLLLLTAILLPSMVDAQPDDAAQRLSRARDKEILELNYAAALQLYTDLLVVEDLVPAIRGDALLGLARCHQGLEQDREAERTLERVVADQALPPAVREEAEDNLRELRAKGNPDVDENAVREEVHRRRQAKVRLWALARVEEARDAYEEGRYELAHRYCVEAIALDPECGEAQALLDEIHRVAPDRTELLRDFIRFAQTVSAQSFVRLKRQVGRLERRGKEAFEAGAYEQADETFRQAIEIIHKSEFFEDLADERQFLRNWLRLTIEEAGKQGVELGAEPLVPGPQDVAQGFRRPFLEALSKLFTTGPAEVDPLVLYTVSEPRPTSSHQGLATGAFPRGISVTRSEGSRTRSWWLERFVRAHIATGWSSPTAGPIPGQGPTRILERFGDTLIVQHTPATQRRVKELLDGFPETPSPVAVDIALIACTTAGGTRLASTLQALAAPRGTGFEFEIPNRLLEECLPLLGGMEGVQILGSARLSLAGRPSATLEITQRADLHPAYQGLQAPPLSLRIEEARFGIHLEIYAEDLPRAAGARRGAVGVRALSRVPQGTVVTPKPSRVGEWERQAMPMAEQGVESVRVLPHAATLLLQGLANPFPTSEVTHPGVIVLVGVRPTSVGGGRTPVPDPPRRVATTNGDGTEEREYDLGPLAGEVVDEVLDANWPQRQATVAVPTATLRKGRERWLATNLGLVWSRLATPEGRSPVTVEGHLARARLSPEEHTRLQAAVASLKAHATALYEVDVLTVEGTEEELAEWLRGAGITPIVESPGTYVVTGSSALTALDQKLGSARVQSSPYALRTRLLARATQKVAARNLRSVSIVDDVRMWRHTDGTQRYIPVPGTAEDGLIVLVRPELEDEEGRRRVTVDARAARLRTLETRRPPQAELEAARLTIPRHYPVQQRSVATPLGDDEALLLTLPTPEGSSRVVVARVRTRKLQ